MEIVAWLAAGLLALALARLLRPAEDPFALAPTIAVGVVGAVVGGAGASLMGGGEEAVGLRTVLLASLGATLAMAAYRFFRSSD